MKTKQEIEQLAQEWFLNDKSLAYGEEFGFIQGYTQCQEDNADKKYTERQLRDAMEGAMVFNKIKQITEYIISLNKQD
jgi:hypothetical protein